MWLGMAAALPKVLRRALMSKEAVAADIARSPDRAVLVQSVLPALAAEAGVILFVGVRAYTRDYAAILESRGGECWTMDRDPRAAPFGVEGRHLTGDIRQVDKAFQAERFDSVVCNGLFGYGVNTASQQAEALAAMATVLKPGGRLVLGWNTSRAPAARVEALLPLSFESRPLADLPVRVAAPGTDHVYAFLARRGRGDA